MNARRSDIPDWVLERYLANDLPAAQADDVRRALDTSASARARLDALRRENAEILLAHPPRLVAPEIEKRAGVKRARPRTYLAVLAPLAVGAAAFAFVVRPADPEIVRDHWYFEGPDTIRSKGDHPQLRVYRRHGTIIEMMEPGAAARAGDTLQLSYIAMGAEYGIVFSIDGRGGVTLHFPERAGQAQKLQNAGEVSLPHAYELDDAPAYERFFIVASNAPVDLDAVLAGARALARSGERAASGYLDLPEGMKQYSFTLRKERP